VLDLLRDYGLDDFYLELSTRPEGKAVGTDEEWAEATEALRVVAEGMDLETVLDEGGGAFYGPKISVQARDAIGRTWQLSTIQVDFQLPQRFGLTYTGSDNGRHQPVMIHRALFGSIERFFGILTEHYAGAFPTWLAPVQVRVLGVRDDHDAYAFRITDRLRGAGFRADHVDAGEPLGARIRKAKLEKLPYVLVVGDDDVANGTVGVNARGVDVERGVTVDDFVDRLHADVLEPRALSRVALERLWAGWRSDYLTLGHRRAARTPRREEGCVSAHPHQREPDEDTDVVWRGGTSFRRPQRLPYASGHLLVLPHRHVATSRSSTRERGRELWAPCARRGRRGRVRPRRAERRGEPREGGRRRGARPPAPPRGAEVGR
jgi:hypothetical protein